MDKGGSGWPAGPMGWPSWATAQGVFSSFFLVLVFFCIFLLLLIFYSVLFHFKSFKHYLKICLMYYNYPCNIRQPPNIFVLIFENFYSCHKFEICILNGFESLRGLQQ